MPSVVQKRAWAKGRSLEIANTTVSLRPAPILLNLRTDVAQTLVSRLGKIFRITFLPFRSFREKEDKSVFTNSKSGATLPTCINSPISFTGEFIQVGKVAPDFELVKTDLSSFSLKDLNGKNVILNIFPSLDTSVCATSVRKFNKMAAGLKDTVVLAISKDLPFAHGRFCTTEGIENVIPLSDFRFSDFDESYGVRMADGPLAGLLARAVVVIGKDGKIAYTELVPEITQEPDYDKALAAVK